MLPRAKSLTLLFAFWLLSTVVLTNCFRGLLSESLMFRHSRSINSFEELGSLGKKIDKFASSYSVLESMVKSKDKNLKQIALDTTISYLNYSLLTEKLADPNTVFLATETENMALQKMFYWMQLKMSKPMFKILNCKFAVLKYSPLRRVLFKE